MFTMINTRIFGVQQAVDRKRIAAMAMAGRPGPRAAARPALPAMTVREAQNRLAKLEARSARRETESHRRSVLDDDYAPDQHIPPVDARTHDEASLFVQATFGPVVREERRARQERDRELFLAAAQFTGRAKGGNV